MKNQKEKKIDNNINKENKKLKLIKKIIYICIGILSIELLLMLSVYMKREYAIDYQDGLNDIKELTDGYIAVGYSNFRNSKSVSKKKYVHTIPDSNEKENIIASQARIARYDNNLDILWEETFPCDYDSIFYHVLPVSDGYIAVGSYVYEYEQIDLNTRDGLIVKYDLEGNILWHDNYQVLGDTEFLKVIESDGNYIVIGQSIYENFELGTHITGGGIILKYDKEGKLIAKNNFGGNKSGIFNDIIEVDDGYIVCGRDATNYGILVKFKKDFDRDENDHELISKKISWVRTYSNTDTAGFTDIEIKDNRIYLTGAVNVSNQKNEEGETIFKYDAGIVTYDLTGKYLNKYTFGGNDIDRYNSMIMNEDNIIVVGITKSSDIEIENYPSYETETGIIIKYNLDGEILEKRYYGGEKQDLLVKIIKLKNDNNMIIGTTNSNRGLFGYDYKPIIEVYDNDLNQIK